MGILRTQSEFGHAPPPQTPYSIVTNIPGWDMLKGVREGDMAPFSKIVHIYPRFSPTHYALTLSREIAQKLSLDDLSCLMYLDPVMWKYTAGHVAHKKRKDNAISPDKLTLRVVDVAGHRLYCVLYDPKDGKAVMNSWSLPGLGVSIREAEYLLGKIDTLTEIPVQNPQSPPPPTWTPEGPSHEALRRRIIDLLRHGAIEADLVQCRNDDVYLYPSGMAAIFEAKGILQEYRPGMTNVELGTVFYNTHQLLPEESPCGLQHFGSVDKRGLDEFEAWLEEEASEGREVTFAFIEFPGNPNLEAPDLLRLKKLSEKYNFVLIVDDTIGSFSNIDVMAYSDMLLTSLTKSFSGRSDVLGGSIVLNPISSHYAKLSERFAAAHCNQLFAADAEVLLSNSRDYFKRAIRLNSNAQAMGEFLHKSMTEDTGSPVVSVQYPSLLASKINYDRFKRRSTPEVPRPGYGCLLTVEFESVEATKAFYDQCGFYPSPHLGGHVTIMFAYNMFSYGRDKDETKKMTEHGVREESVRISAGLEDAQDLLDTLQDALDAAMEVKKKTQAK